MVTLSQKFPFPQTFESPQTNFLYEREAFVISKRAVFVGVKIRLAVVKALTRYVYVPFALIVASVTPQSVTVTLQTVSPVIANVTRQNSQKTVFVAIVRGAVPFDDFL